MSQRATILPNVWTQTCIPEGPTTSKAAIILETKCTTFVKLSSPILQEPSMRNTTSALAPLQTEEREAVSVQQQRNQNLQDQLTEKTR